MSSNGRVPSRLAPPAMAWAQRAGAWLRPALVALNVALLLALALIWVFGALSWHEPDPVAVDVALLELIGAEPQAADYDKDEVLARPLFMADRRPLPADAVVEPVPEAVAAPADPLAAARLLGLVGEGSAAFVIIRSGEQTSRLPVGGELGAWKLERVDALGADFVSSAGESKRIAIQRGGVAGPASDAGASAEVVPGSPQARAAERRARREAQLRQAQERNR